MKCQGNYSIYNIICNHSYGFIYIIWYILFRSNNRHCLQSAFDITNGFEKKVLICMGDFNQMGPVVRFGGMQETIAASMISSTIWPLFQVFEFSENMRLTGLAIQDLSGNK